MEWGVISGGGHVIVYGCDSLMGWDPGDYDIYVAKNDYASLWKKINSKPGVFAYLAHPQTTDYDSLFTKPFNAHADSAIIGMAGRSGPAFSTDSTYTDPSTGNYIARYNDALKKGYHVGIGLDHDTHNSVFARQTPGRLVVMAPSLTRANILDAISKMRFYCSDDWNTQVDFSISTQPMGSILVQAGSPTISVSVTDPDVAETVASIKIYYGIPGSGSTPTILTSNSGSASLTFTHTIANLASYYYYLQITQTDGDVIWTSPIWYNRNDNASINTYDLTTNDFLVYPNPASKNISLDFQSLKGKKEIEVLDANGKLVLKQNSVNDKMIVTIENLPSGNYFVRVTCNGKTSSQKVIVKN
jgi:hypothetical protein